jgi:hypothetical protein
MLGYTENDLDNMMGAIQAALTKVNSDGDPWLHGNLTMAEEFLRGLWEEGHFS